MSLSQPKDTDSNKSNSNLVRSAGMQEVPLLTGFYGADGKKIKHKVHRGALQLPPEALELYKKNDDEEEIEKEVKLPPLDFVKRPSLDPNTQCIQTVIRRQERIEEYINPLDGTLQCRTVASRLIRNEIVPKLKEAGAERIRGGGDEDENAKDPPIDSKPDAGVSNTQTTHMETSNPEQSSKPEETHKLVVPTNSSAGGQSNNAPDPNAKQAQAEGKSGIAPTTSVPTEGVPEESKITPTVNEQPSQAQPDDNKKPTAAVPSDLNPPASIPSTPVKTEPKIEPTVLPLKKRPPSQWEQRSVPTDDVTSQPKASPKPDWYKKDEASDLERSLLPEWFDQSANHRTPKSYVETREKIIEMASRINRYLTSTLMRRAIPGDSGSLIRLHELLTSYGLINAAAHTKDSAPTPQASMRPSHDVRKRILDVVSDHVSAKKAHVDDSASTIDWKAVSLSVQNGVTPAFCEREFLAATGQQQRGDTGLLWTPDEMLQKVDPSVISATVNAALKASADVQEAQAASLAGVLSVTSENEAQSKEDGVNRILSEIVDLRMQKLEQRIHLLDEVEDMLDSERVALSVERRDLYTARCRHWFGRT